MKDSNPPKVGLKSHSGHFSQEQFGKGEEDEEMGRSCGGTQHHFLFDAAGEASGGCWGWPSWGWEKLKLSLT